MAEGEGKSFENKTFETSAWDDDDYGDETTPFLQSPQGSSTPQYQTRVSEEMEMNTMQQQAGGPDTIRMLCGQPDFLILKSRKS